MRVEPEQPELSVPVPIKHEARNAASERPKGWIWTRWTTASQLLAGGGTARYALAILILGLAAAAGYGVYFLFGNRGGTAPFQNFAITQVTNTGTAALAAISPDGKYVLRVENTNGKQALWLQNVPTNSDVRSNPRARFTVIWRFHPTAITSIFWSPRTRPATIAAFIACQCWAGSRGKSCATSTATLHFHQMGIAWPIFGGMIQLQVNRGCSARIRMEPARRRCWC